MDESQLASHVLAVVGGWGWNGGSEWKSPLRTDGGMGAKQGLKWPATF